MLGKHRKKHVHAVDRHARGAVARPFRGRGVAQGLNFDAKSAPALQCRRHSRSCWHEGARGLFCVLALGVAEAAQRLGARWGEEHACWVVHLDQPSVAHHQERHFRGCTEPVLGRAQHTNGRGSRPLALEQHNCVHKVLQHSRSGDLARLGHVPHQDDGHGGGLGKLEQPQRALPDLRNSAGRGGNAVQIHGLNAVHDDGIKRKGNARVRTCSRGRGAPRPCR